MLAQEALCASGFRDRSQMLLLESVYEDNKILIFHLLLPKKKKKKELLSDNAPVYKYHLMRSWWYQEVLCKG